jgi:rhamnosyltransferase
MISVIIPTLNGAHLLPRLVDTLRRQTVRNIELIVVDSESRDETAQIAAGLGCQVHTILRRTFDHGGARNFAVEKASGDILVFLTQDILPFSPEFLARLTAPVQEGTAAAAYARQVPAKNASPREAFLRLYNYPRESYLRHISGVKQRTLKTFFFSNAASAVSRRCFENVGRFPVPVSTNEDMILCARLLDVGYSIAYVAEAEVIHSHDLSLVEVFRRYFRMGFVVREYRGTLRSVGNIGDGIDFVRRQVSHLRCIGRSDLIPGALVEAVVKGLAYRCGQASQSRVPQDRIPQPLQTMRSSDRS